MWLYITDNLVVKELVAVGFLSFWCGKPTLKMTVKEELIKSWSVHGIAWHRNAKGHYEMQICSWLSLCVCMHAPVLCALCVYVCVTDVHYAFMTELTIALCWCLQSREGKCFSISCSYICFSLVIALDLLFLHTPKWFLKPVHLLWLCT